MKLNAPKRLTWLITLIAGIVGAIALIVSLFNVPVVGIVGACLVIAALAVLLAANVMSGL